MTNNRETAAPPLGGYANMLTAKQVAESLPGRSAGGRMHTATIRKWSDRGVALPDGRVVRLPRVKLGSKHWYRPSDVEWFIAEIGDAFAPEPPAPRAAARREREIDAAMERCRKLGAKA